MPAAQELDLPQVLLAIHTFFTTLGPQELSLRSARKDGALEMVKRVLFEVRGVQAVEHKAPLGGPPLLGHPCHLPAQVCRVKGADIYRFLGLVPGTRTDAGTPSPLACPPLPCRFTTARYWSLQKAVWTPWTPVSMSLSST